MPKVLTSTCAVVSLGAVVAGCQSAPARYANDGVHATYSAAATGASAMRQTGGQLYVGAGDAMRKPFHDLNLMQDKIAPVLLRAESHPYDLTAVNSCNDVLDRVSELDLALGPDVDAPKQRHKARMMRGADFAASAALDAAGSAAEHFLPMRSTIKQISGAQRYENHVKHAQLAGATRRSFLKAIGMEHSCSWPAAPLDFAPVQVADAAAPWSSLVVTSPAQTGGAPVVLVSAAGKAGASTAVTGGATPAPSPATVTLASTRSASTPPAVATVQTARISMAQVAMISRAAPSSGRVLVPVRDNLAVPRVAIPADASQAWRPAQRSDVADVSAPAAGGALTGSAAAAAPWSAAFTAAGRP